MGKAGVVANIRIQPRHKKWRKHWTDSKCISFCVCNNFEHWGKSLQDDYSKGLWGSNRYPQNSTSILNSMLRGTSWTDEKESEQKYFFIFSNDLFFILASAPSYSSTKCAYMDAYISTLFSSSTSLQLLFCLQTIFVSISAFQLFSFFVPVFSFDWLFFPSLTVLFSHGLKLQFALLLIP